MTEYLKEDRKRVLQKATELKEMSAFGKEFAQHMRDQGPGGVYRSRITGKNILLKYGDKTGTQKPDKMSSSQYEKEKQMAKQNMAAPRPANKSSELPSGKMNPPGTPVQPDTSSFTRTQSAKPSFVDKMTPAQYDTERQMAKQNMAATKPQDTTTTNVSVQNDRVQRMGMLAKPDRTANMTTPSFRRGVDTDNAVKDNMTAPDSTSSTRASVTTATPEIPKVSSALADRIKPEQLASHPRNLKETVVSVGSNKYRIV